jgi:hypothetical protein
MAEGKGFEPSEAFTSPVFKFFFNEEFINATPIYTILLLNFSSPKPVFF